MATDITAPRLEQEVDTLISAALKAGLGGRVAMQAPSDGKTRHFTVDRIFTDDEGYPHEVWFSASCPATWWDRIQGQTHKDLVRVSRNGGDVRRSVSSLSCSRNRTQHKGFREEVGAPRLSRSVATFKYPRPDATAWLHTYGRTG